LVLQVQGRKQLVTLRPLRHKLQWNLKKRSARQPEPDEREAYRHLSAKIRAYPKMAFLKTRKTG